jgi:hypothetical protein
MEMSPSPFISEIDSEYMNEVDVLPPVKNRQAELQLKLFS